MSKQNEFLCPYCNIEMIPSGHSSGVCNGWKCMECNHEEPEMGSYSLAGRPEADINCYCKRCIELNPHLIDSVKREINKLKIEKKGDLFYVSGILTDTFLEPFIKTSDGKLIRSFNCIIYKDKRFNAIFKGIEKVTHDLIAFLREGEIIYDGKIFKKIGKFNQIKEGALIEYKDSYVKKIKKVNVFGGNWCPNNFSDELIFYNPK